MKYAIHAYEGLYEGLLEKHVYKAIEILSNWKLTEW